MGSLFLRILKKVNIIALEGKTRGSKNLKKSSDSAVTTRGMCYASSKLIFEMIAGNLVLFLISRS